MRTGLIALAVLAAVVVVVAMTRREPAKVAADDSEKYNALTEEEARVILHEGTERAFSGKYWDHKEDGTYTCKRCDAPLFESSTKFDSGTGWPSFDDAIPGAIKEVPDGLWRTEIECANCGAHIGHVFRGEGFTEKDTRHCANSISLNFAAATDEEQTMETKSESGKTSTDLSTANTGRAIFAGGCFWGVEHYLQMAPGVLSVTSGYIGGKTENPSYKDVCYKDTGHAEAVEVKYDPSKTDYETLAKLFFEIHDPTQVNRQGPDIGDQYRSAVFYENEAQKAITEKLIEILEEKGYDVATQVVPATTFWPAEEYHQDYYEKTGKTPYCHARVERF